MISMFSDFISYKKQWKHIALVVEKYCKRKVKCQKNQARLIKYFYKIVLVVTRKIIVY